MTSFVYASRAAVCCALLLCLGCGVSMAQYPTVPNVTVSNGFVAELWAPNLPNVRSLVLDEASGSVLALVRGTDSIVSLTENKEGTAVTVTTLVDNSTLKLNHGLALHNKYIYASSASTVYRWPYAANKPITDKPQIVVKDIPSVKPPGEENGRTRSLLFNGDKLYVAIGTRLNVDPDPTRSRIVTFDLSNKIPEGGFAWTDGKKFADGLRNTVGLALDDQGRVWGAECGADHLVREDLGADLEQDNPAEEINLLEEGNFGFPYCFTAWNIPNATKPGNNQQLQQFIWPSMSPDFNQKYTDEWCRQRANNRPPMGGLAGHSVPIGITFYNAKGCREKGGFDCWMKGDLFVAMRGSFDKKVPNGFQVARVPYVNGKPSTNPPIPLIQHTDYQKNCVTDDQKATCFRAVGTLFLPSGKLLVAVDIAKGYVVRLSRDTGVSLTSDKGGSSSAVINQAAGLWAVLATFGSLLMMLVA